MIGPHFRCPENKPEVVCFFYFLDAYKAKKLNEIPAALRHYVNTVFSSVSHWKNKLFPRHFFVKDGLDALVEFGKTVGIQRTIDLDLSNFSARDWIKRNLRLPKIFIPGSLRYLLY